MGVYTLTSNDRAQLWPNSILLIGANNVAILTIAWTLFHEVLFYLLFASLIISKRLGTVTLLLWFGLCVLWFGNTPPHYGLAAINLLFGFGIVTAHLAQRIPLPRLCLIIGVAAFLLVGYEVVNLALLNENEWQIAFGLAAALCIGSAVKAESEGLLRAPRWLVRLGDSSYSLYLVHYPLLALLAKVWLGSRLANSPPIIAFVVLVTLCVAGGFAFHLLVEKPSLALMRRKAPREAHKVGVAVGPPS